MTSSVKSVNLDLLNRCLNTVVAAYMIAKHSLLKLK